jgi:hypothetical protein
LFCFNWITAWVVVDDAGAAGYRISRPDRAIRRDHLNGPVYEYGQVAPGDRDPHTVG